MNKKSFMAMTRSVLWHLTLLTVGGTIYSFGLKGLAVPHEFISGGIFGAGMLIYYIFSIFSPAIWYAILNIPLFIAGWAFLSPRFFLFSLYGLTVTTVSAQYLDYIIPVADPMLAAITGGCICGLGIGIVLYSWGCDGGLSMIATILHQRYGIKVGQFFFAINIILFSVAGVYLDFEKIMYSIVFIFVSSNVTDYVLSMFNERKLAFIISDKSHAIADGILSHLNRGATFLQGYGAFSGAKKDVLMVVTHNHQIKRMEEIVFDIDANAFVIIENTFNVLGSGFSKKKVY